MPATVTEVSAAGLGEAGLLLAALRGVPLGAAVAAVLAGAADKLVLAGAADQLVLASFAEQLVLAGAALQQILACAAAGNVVSLQAGDAVVAAEGGDHVGLLCALELVGAGGAGDRRGLAVASSCERSRGRLHLEGADVASGALGPLDAAGVACCAGGDGVSASRVDRRTARQQRRGQNRSSVVADRAEPGILADQIAGCGRERAVRRISDQVVTG